jgi:hypothetical protein
VKLARLLGISIITTACAVICFAQGTKTAIKPDLSGTWGFDRKRSNAGKSKDASKPPEQIKITHVDPELRIRRKVSVNDQIEERELVYYTDGRGETNPTTAYITTNPGSRSGRPPETNSQTSWRGDKIISKSIFGSPVGRAALEFEIIVEWRLSTDGKTLTQTTRTIAKPDPMSNSIFVAGGGRDFKSVYNLLSK